MYKIILRNELENDATFYFWAYVDNVDPSRRNTQWLEEFYLNSSRVTPYWFNTIEECFEAIPHMWEQANKYCQKMVHEVTVMQIIDQKEIAMEAPLVKSIGTWAHPE